MNLESRNEKKKLGIVRFINSFKYSFDGLLYAFKKEQSVFVMIFVATIAISLGIIFRVNAMDWFFIFIVMALVLGTELINTSIEATIDLLSPGYHPLAKIAKDTASAAVFVYSIIAFVIGCFIFMPYIIKIIGK